MARLIYADSLMKFPIRIDHYDKEHGNEDFVLGIETVLEYVENLPTVDAVEVVRCKDCENWQKPWLVDQTLGVCQIGKKSLTEPCHFCSYGERRNDG